MFKKLRQWIGMTSRAMRLRAAGRMVRPLGCTTVSSDLLLQVAKKLAELDSYIEQSGEIAHRKHLYGKLVSSLREIGQTVEAAVKIGDPTMQAQQLFEVYMQARWLSMSGNQRKKIQKAQAAQEITQKFVPAPAATVTP